MGVEPTGDIKCPPTDLKSAKPTGTQTLPKHVFFYSKSLFFVTVSRSTNIIADS